MTLLTQPLMPRPVTLNERPMPLRRRPVWRWPIALLGIPFDSVTLEHAVTRIESMIAHGGTHVVVTPNVDFLVQAQRDRALRDILVEADLVLCDGRPLVWASRWLGNPLPARVAGSDLVPALLRRAATRNWKLFILGGAEGVAAEAARRIRREHPMMSDVGHYAPPHQPLEAMDHAGLVARIRAFQPDILLVCMGCPKQEKWIARNRADLGVPVIIGAGATVDFLAGRVRRAPVWMRSVGLEWLYRLGQEPRRLFRRYADDFCHFLPALIAQRRELPPGRAVAAGSPRSTSWWSPRRLFKVASGPRLDALSLAGEQPFWAQAFTQRRSDCWVDLGEVTQIDSTGVALLACWHKRLATAGRHLILVRPSTVVRTALRKMGLLDRFAIREHDPEDGAVPPTAAPAPDHPPAPRR